MKKYTEPFPHYYIEDFLNPQLYQRLKGVYDHLQFLQKESDLFHFFQTNELASEKSLEFFRKELGNQFKQLTPMKDTFYSIFASYYFKGNHLLCHDDVVQDRKYAFSYYLQDYNSGELVLYDKTATKVEKKIKVKKNLLVIFQVSNISYHQVALAKQDGRKAVTGWLNQKGWGATRPPKVTLPYQSSIPSNIISFDFPQDISTQEYYSFPGVEYEFNLKSSNLIGPFYQRKAMKLTLQQCVVMKLKGYGLYSADFFQFNKGDYMLLNDPVNNIQGDILDVFILQMPKGTVEGELITIVSSDGEVQGNIPYATDTMFMVHRGDKKYYMNLVLKQIRIGHLIYKKKKAKIASKKVVQEKQIEKAPKKSSKKEAKINKTKQSKKKNRSVQKVKSGEKKTVKRKFINRRVRKVINRGK